METTEHEVDSPNETYRDTLPGWLARQYRQKSVELAISMFNANQIRKFNGDNTNDAVVNLADDLYAFIMGAE